MQQVRWLGFCIANALTRTIVHFYPAARNVNAPYPVVCHLTLFGVGIERETVQLEGARLRQPDGVRLRDIFVPLQEEAVGVFGLMVELSTVQPRLDLGASSCIIEFASRGLSARYRPVKLDDEGDKAEKPAAIAFCDELNTTSLVLVNALENSLNPKFLRCDAGQNWLAAELPGFKEGVPPESAYELELGLGGDAPEQCEAMPSAVALDATPVGAAACFALIRETSTKRPISVCAL